MEHLGISQPSAGQAAPLEDAAKWIGDYRRFWEENFDRLDAFGLAYLYALARTTRFADGPDEVHRNQIARLEYSKYTKREKAEVA